MIFLWRGCVIFFTIIHTVTAVGTVKKLFVQYFWKEQFTTFDNQCDVLQFSQVFFPYVPESLVLNWPPSEITKSRTCHHQKTAESRPCNPPKMAESPNLVSLGVASSGLSHFRGWQVQDSVFFWILEHSEIWGWQEGLDTLYLVILLKCHGKRSSVTAIRSPNHHK